MVKIETCSYKPLNVRRQHACNMKIIVASLFGVLVLTGITGHLFSRRGATTTPAESPQGPHHEALAKLIRTSEDAIGWIGNKTIDSIKNIKNLTALAVTPESQLVVKKNQILNWLREVARYNTSTNGAESSMTEVPGDSGESVVIAHRKPGQGFSWGPPRGTDVPPQELPRAAGGRVPGVLSYLYQASRNITRRGKDILLSSIDKVKSAKESFKTKWFKKSEKQEAWCSAEEGTTPTSAPDVEKCDEGEDDRVCAVDWSKGVFAIFPSGCWVRAYNREHGTDFSVHDSTVCINLFAHHPENYQKIDNPPV